MTTPPRAPARAFVTAALLALAAASAAHAQCDGAWLPGEAQRISTSPDSDRILDAVYWDPDGPDGPEEPNLIIAGDFAQRGGAIFNHVARWNGRSWMPMGESLQGPGFSSAVSDLCVWDPDGPGPQTPQLIAAGQFASSGGVTVSGLARWDGSLWQPAAAFGIGLPTCATGWDPDGDGPLHEQLVIGGPVVIAGTRGMAGWDGAAWHPFGGGITGQFNVLTLRVWDADADGPLEPRLYIGGAIGLSGVPGSGGILCWDGTQWITVDGGVGQQEHPSFITGVLNMVPWDPDADGPLNEHLLVLGNFGQAGSLAVNSAALFNGQSWSVPPFAPGPDGAIFSELEFDPDGPGPETRDLVLGGAFAVAGVPNSDNIARWNGTTWSPVERGIPGASGKRVGRLVPLDADGPGPTPPTLLAVGDFVGGSQQGSPPLVQSFDAIEWNGVEWAFPGTGISHQTVIPVNMTIVRAFDVDGDGPTPARLLAAGSVDTRVVGVQRRVIEWDGLDWRPVSNNSIPSMVSALTLWDADGPGPGQARVVIADSSEGQNRIRILLDDGTWTTLGTCSHTIRDLTAWDPDADGPALPLVVVAGDFTTVNGVTVNRIARYDGSTWTGFGTGITGSGGVSALHLWDLDGPDAQAPQLVAAGGFATIGGVTANSVARWDGAQWLAFGEGVMDGSAVAGVIKVCSLDRDADGPEPDSLVAFGYMTRSGSVTLTGNALWNGIAWEPFASALPGTAPVNGLVAFDHDNDSATPDRIAASSESVTIDVPGPYVSRGVAMWNGTQWIPFAHGVDSTGQPIPIGPASSLATWKPGNANASELVLSGNFRTADGLQSQGIARWTANRTSWLAEHPEPVTIDTGDTVTMTARPAFGYAALEHGLAYEWLRNGKPIVNGPGGAAPGGGEVVGAHGVIHSQLWITLTINAAAPVDAGNYSLRIFNDCGEARSEPAALTVVGAICLTDVNDDGVVNSTDVSDFINIWFDDQSAGTLLADFNHDGVSNSTDVSDFINQWFTETAEGCN